jgi:hypothetical protein
MVVVEWPERVDFVARRREIVAIGQSSEVGFLLGMTGGSMRRTFCEYVIDECVVHAHALELQ